MRKVGRIASVGFFGIVAAGVAAIKVFADFDQAMTESLAIMTDVTDEQRDQLESVVRDIAKTTTFSATEVAEAIFFLASAGLDATEALDALPVTATFAQAGMFDMATATDILTDAQSALGLSSDDTVKNLENLIEVGDVLVQANNTANASVLEFGTALISKAATAAVTLNLDLEDTVTVLEVFAEKGIKGEKAGTLFANTMAGLTKANRDARPALDRLGISIVNLDGSMRDMPDIIGDMEDAFADLSVEQIDAELANLGFTKQAKEGILALVGSSEKLREWEADLRVAGGAAQEVADKQLESFSAKMGLIKSRVIDLGIEIGSRLAPVVLSGLEAMDRFWEEHKETIIPILERIKEIAQEVFGKLVGWFRKIWAWLRINLPKALEFMKDEWEKWEQPIKDVMNNIKETVEGLRDVVKEVFGAIPGWLGRSNDGIEGEETRTGQSLETTGGFFQGLQDTVDSTTAASRVFFQHFGDDIVETSKIQFGFVGDVIGRGLTLIETNMKIATALMEGDWKGFHEGLVENAKIQFGFLADAWSTGWELIKINAGLVWEEIGTELTLAYDGFNTETGDFIGDFVQFWIDLPGQLKREFPAMVTAFFQLGGDIANAIVNGLANLPLKLALVGSTSGASLWDGVAEWVNKIIDAWNSLSFELPSISKGPFKIGGGTIGVTQIPNLPTFGETAPAPNVDFFGSGPIQVGPVDRLAHGGTLMSAGTVLVGESGPEFLDLPRAARVTPLDRAGGTTIIVNIEGSVLTDRDLEWKLRDMANRGMFGQIGGGTRAGSRRAV